MPKTLRFDARHPTHCADTLKCPSHGAQIHPGEPVVWIEKPQGGYLKYHAACYHPVELLVPDTTSINHPEFQN